jgi:predicted DNA-binding ribbon-helix-helix protein
LIRSLRVLGLERCEAVLGKGGPGVVGRLQLNSLPAKISCFVALLASPSGANPYFSCMSSRISNRRSKRLALWQKSSQTCQSHNEQEREGGMCHLFASQNPDSYIYETRSIRLNGQSTSIRLERMFWNILEQIAALEGLSVPSFISTLHREVLLMWGPVPNFTSHLRCICLVALEKRVTERPAASQAAPSPEQRRHVVVG